LEIIYEFAASHEYGIKLKSGIFVSFLCVRKIKMVKVVALLAFLACAVSANVLQELSAAAKDELCTNMKESGSLFSPIRYLHYLTILKIRCAHPDEDPRKHGRSYKLKHPNIQADDLAPVILLPGLGASGLEAQLNKNDSPG
jgi:hypothetical protein